jgi:hypothetical protein
MEIACDESGSEGEKLVGATTDVFAHASVRLADDAAAECLRELRGRAPCHAVEYKAYHILRERNRPALTWLLEPAGPLSGHAHVHLTDKAFFVVGKLVDLIVGSTDHGTSADWYRDRERLFSQQRWAAVLESANNFMRARNRREVPGDPFGELAAALADSPFEAPLWAAKPRIDAYRERLLGEPAAVPALEPLVPAVVRTVRYWSAAGQPVQVVHDRHNALTPECVAVLRGLLGDRLAGVRLVDSRRDSRVQIADVLAGAARKIASDELNGRGDAELAALLEPYVDPESVWLGTPGRPLVR